MLPKVIAQWKQSLATGTPFDMDFPLRGADGIFRWFLTRVSPLRDADGKVVRWFGTNTNIDEQRRQAALLKEAVQARDAFLSIASHELKTPLTPMALRLQVLQKTLESQSEAELRKQVQSYVAVANKQIGKLLSLINDLLDVSRIAEGRFKMELEQADIALLLREVISRFDSECTQAGTVIDLRAPEHLLLLTAKLRLDQVFTNLIDNAVKYGGGKPVEVTLTATDDSALVTVTDHGIGIASENLPRIFDRFERAVPDRNYGGLGLGLYISRNIVEALGGTVQVQSTPMQGSTFTVILPRRAREPRQGLSPNEVVESVAGFFQIPRAESAALVERALAGQDWTAGPGDGTWLMPVNPGTNTGAAKGFLVRIAKGATYPYHVHEADEHVLVFQGGLTEPDGKQIWPGERVLNVRGTGHWSKANEKDDCYLAAMVMRAPDTR